MKDISLKIGARLIMRLEIELIQNIDKYMM